MDSPYKSLEFEMITNDNDNSSIIRSTIFRPPVLRSKASKFFKHKGKSIGVGCMCLFSVVNTLMLIMVLVNHGFTLSRNHLQISDVITSISKNLGKSPITDIIIIKDQQITCPPEYELIDIGSWPGTVNGCYCMNSDILSPNTCESKAESDCINYRAFDPIKLIKWKKAYFCVQRGPHIQLKTNDCPDEYKKCSWNLCYPENDPCPVTSFNIDKENVQITNVVREIQGKPIVSLIISINSRPCLNPSDYPYDETKSPYLLLNLPNPGCDIFGFNPETQVIDSMNEIQLYSDNDLRGLIQILPGYEKYIMANIVYLSYAMRFSMKRENVTEACYNTDFLRLETVNHSIENMEIAVIIGTILLIILNLIFLGYFFNELINEGGKFANLADKIQEKPELLIQFFCIFTLIVIFYLILKEYSKDVLDYQYYVLSIADLNCFENIEVTNMLKKYGNKLPSIINDVMLLLMIYYWFSILSVVFIIFGLTYKFIYRHCL